MSYLLTYSGKAVQEFHTTHAKARRYTQHVVRWGKSWGFIQASPNWDTAWQAEQRTPAADYEHGAEKFLLEKTTPSPLQAPPLQIDDMWSEMVCFDRHIKAGNLLYIRGTLSEIQETLKQLNISTPPWLQPLALQEQPQSPTKEPQQYPMTLPQQPPQPSQALPQQGQPRRRPQAQQNQLQQRASQMPLRRMPTSTGGTTSSRPPQPSFQHRQVRPSPASGPPSSPAQSSHSTQSRSQGTPHQRNQSRQTSAQRGQTSQ